MARLGVALIGAGDGLRRVDTGDWQGEAAESFRRVFEPVPAHWSGSGEAFLRAADAIGDYVEVLEWARGEGEAAAREWAGAQALSAHPRSSAPFRRGARWCTPRMPERWCSWPTGPT